jgi:5-methylcytosine-specific restriction protein B
LEQGGGLAGQLLRYRDLPPVARIVANKGMSEVLAVGTVTGDGYRYDPDLPEYRHTVAVDWDTSYAPDARSPGDGCRPSTT